ncbi:Glycerol-3-phosphate acyltransferase 2, mitochondrial [Apodemus speciosus]|uniref:Glycerol-3-phosphate acyltransferase 2, mitochondrial n=1 Tax=Apodemus speciosus TaxID=105296 RepID=A0ABQ0EIC9_APOSI
MDTMLKSKPQAQQRTIHNGQETSLWSSGFGMKMEAITPFLGKYRPFMGRCCQTCTPKSWGIPLPQKHNGSGLLQCDPWFRGWLVRRLCYFLWSLEQHIPTSSDASQKIMESPGLFWLCAGGVTRETDHWYLAQNCRPDLDRVQNLLSGRVPGAAGEGQAPDLVKKEVQRILGHIQTTPRPFLLSSTFWGAAGLTLLHLKLALLPRLFSWALLWFLNRLFLNVQLHKGQMKMVHKAVQESLLDGFLLPFVLFSQGLGVVRVALDSRTCSPALRALLRKLGGLFLPPEANLSLDSSEGILARAVVRATMEHLLTSGQPLLIFLEEPPGYPGPRLSALGQAWLGLVVQAFQEGIISDATLVPVATAYDLVPDAPCSMNHVRPGVQVDTRSGWHSMFSSWDPLGRKSNWDVKCLKDCPIVTILQRLPRSMPSPFYNRAHNRGHGWKDRTWRGAMNSIVAAPRLAQENTCAASHSLQDLAPLGLWTGALAVFRRLCNCWGCNRRVCVRVHLAQPFSLQEYTINARSCWGSRQTLEHLLQPIVLGECSVVPDTEKEQEWTPLTGLLLALKEEDQLLVRRLSRHVLSVSLAENEDDSRVEEQHVPAEGTRSSDVTLARCWASVASSAVMSTAIMATLLLLKHQKGVVLSQLLGEFSWLTEETLLRGFDVGFSGQLRCLAQHTLSLLRAHVVLLRVHQGDLVVVPRPGPGLTHLARLSMELLPTFLSEAVGACAVRGLLAGRVPPEGPWELQGIELLSQNELYRQILLLLHLLPQDLLLPQPCQSSYCYCQEVLDRLIQCGLLVAEETPGSRPACDTGRQHLSAKLLWKPSGDFTDSESDDFDEPGGRCFRLSQQSRCPDFFLFLCRLLSPILKAFAQAATFLHLGQLPDSEEGYSEKLFQFLQACAQEEGIFECADPNLAISAIWTFKDLGVLQQMPGPTGPQLHLAPTFATRDNQDKLEQFIRQFICS